MVLVNVTEFTVEFKYPLERPIHPLEIFIAQTVIDLPLLHPNFVTDLARFYIPLLKEALGLYLSRMLVTLAENSMYRFPITIILTPTQCKFMFRICVA